MEVSTASYTRYYSMDEKVLDIIQILGMGGVIGTFVTWLLNRRKQTADITETITKTSQMLLDSLTKRVNELELDIKELTEQNRILAEQNNNLTYKLSAIGKLIIEAKGDSIEKIKIAEVLR